MQANVATPAQSSHRSQTAHPAMIETQSGQAFSQGRCWKLASPKKVIKTAASNNLRLRQSCTFRKQPKQQTKLSTQLQDCRNWRAPTQPFHPSNTQPPLRRIMTATTGTSAHRKSHLSGPQFQAQFSRFTDRICLKRLNSTLLSRTLFCRKPRLKTCAALKSPISGCTIWTRARQVS